ncbi:MAG: methyltransferase domain-containing protein [Bryobacteraceae bacterium]
MALPDIAELRRAAEAFQPRLAAARRQRPSLAWYPYDSLANLVHLDQLLTGSRRRLLDLAAAGPIVDIGCADGDLAFFLESAGAEVHAIDYPVTNHNGMAGVFALKEILGSRIPIHEVNLDASSHFPLPQSGLAFLLGALYHLKNPFFVLETLARHSRHCVLSTRIARRLPDGAPIDGKPLVYLVDTLELNGDNSNFWIFTETALRRLLKRAHWDVLDWMTIGDRAASDPIHLDHDERAFCLARSTWEMANVELLAGWHESEGAGWRWTEPSFSVRARWENPDPPMLRLQLYLPPQTTDTHGAVTLSCAVNGQPLRPQTYSAAGDCVYERALPVVPEIRLDFSVDPFLVQDSRRLGIIVAAISLE